MTTHYQQSLLPFINNKSFINPVFFISGPLFQWKEAKPDELMDSKLRCAFEMPVENEKTVSTWARCFSPHVGFHCHFRSDVEDATWNYFSNGFMQLFRGKKHIGHQQKYLYVFFIISMWTYEGKLCRRKSWQQNRCLCGLNGRCGSGAVLSSLLSVPLALLSLFSPLFVVVTFEALIFITFLRRLSFPSFSPRPHIISSHFDQSHMHFIIVAFSPQAPHSCRDIIPSWYEPGLLLSWARGGKRSPAGCLQWVLGCVMHAHSTHRLLKRRICSYVQKSQDMNRNPQRVAAKWPVRIATETLWRQTLVLLRSNLSPR